MKDHITIDQQEYAYLFAIQQMETFHKSESKYVFITVNCACHILSNKEKEKWQKKQQNKIKIKIKQKAYNLQRL